MEFLRADVSSLSDLRAALQHQGDSITGIIHAAGLVNDAKLEDMDWTSFHEVLRPKVHGAYHLHRLTRSDVRLSIFTMFSSSSAALGSRRQCNYLAANSFLDAAAFFRQEAGLCGLSIGWSAWDVGMAQRLPTPSGMRKISTLEGVEAFQRVCWAQLPLAHILPVQVDWLSYLTAYGKIHGTASCLQHLAYNSARQASSEDDRSLAQALSEKLQQILRCNFDLTEIDEETGFGELGLDSLDLEEFATRVAEEVGVTIGVIDLFDCSNIAMLVAFLLKRARKSPEEQGLLGVLQGPLSNDNKFPADRQLVWSLQTTARPGACHSCILGVACRYPGGVSSIDELWHTFASGQDCVDTLPADRWGPRLAEEIYTDSIAHLDQLDSFDAGFFNVPPASAKFMDPLLRLSLESVYHALEDAGIVGGDVDDTTAVVAGYMTADFLQAFGNGRDAAIPAGTMQGMFPGHISHFFNFTGPSKCCQSTCSSSLVALDAAKKEVEFGSCARAVALGANVILSLDLMVQACKMGMLSRKGRCLSFDQAADGYVRGEGSGVVLLGSQVSHIARGTLLGSASGHNGHSAALTQPNPKAQQRVIELAIHHSGASAVDVGYLEAHGTGTPLGDPIEVKALRGVFAGVYSQSSPLFVGTAKSTFGHLEAAAGILGVHRSLCCLLHSCIPRHIWLKNLSERVVEEMGEKASWCHIVGEETSWRGNIAGVSSFGLSGTNAHVMVQSVSPSISHSPGIGTPVVQHSFPCILVFSAKSSHSLEALKIKYTRSLSDPSANTWEICLASAAGRAHFPHRFAAVGGRDSLLDALRRPCVPTKLQKSRPVVHVEVEADPGICGQDLCDRNPVFRTLVDLFGSHFAQVEMPLALASLLESWGLQVQLSGSSVETLSKLQEVVQMGRAWAVGKWDVRALKKKVSSFPWPGYAGDRLRVRSLQLQQTVFALNGDFLPALLELLAHLYIGWESTLDWRSFSASFGQTEPLRSLPLYAFDRQRHWPQPSMSAELFFKDPVSGALWYTVKLELDGPWRFLLDHLMEGKAIMPAATQVELLLDVAKKAMMQLDRPVHQVILKDLAFLAPLQLDHSPLKCMISCLEREDSLELKAFEESNIFCQARAVPSQEDQSPEHFAHMVSRRKGSKMIESEQIYREFCAVGLDYQKSFRVLQKAEIFQGEVWAEITADFFTTWLDGALQALGLALSHLESLMPRAIGKVQIFADPHSLHSILRITRLYASWTPRPVVKCFDASGKVVALLEDISVQLPGRRPGTYLQERPAQNAGPWAPESVFFQKIWAPENSKLLGLMQREQETLVAKMAERAGGKVWDTKQEEERSKKLNDLARAYRVEILSLGTLKDLPHCAKLKENLQHALQRATVHDSLAKDFCEGRVCSAATQIQLRADLVEPCPELAILRKCGDRLAAGPTLAEDADVLSLLSPEKDELYEHGISSRAANDFIAECVSAVQHVAPKRTSILEIGAGSGATTKAIFSHFQPAQYHFTDLSKAFFKKIEGRLDVSTAILDVEKDPCQQGFAPHSFNLVICSNVLHATRDLAATLRHIRRVCVPGSILLLSETVCNDEWLDLTFGLLSGWWRFTGSDPDRSSTLLSLSSWQRRLREEGFRPLCHFGGRQVVILATAESESIAAAPRPPSGSFVWLVKPQMPSARAEELSRWLIKLLRHAGDLEQEISVEART